MKSGFIPFRTPDTPDAADQAKEYCKSRGLTAADVQICRRDRCVLVEVKRDGATIKV